MRNVIVRKEQCPHDYQEVWEQNLYGLNLWDVEGKPVLDVGAHFGFFSLLTLHYNCKSVTAVEADATVIPALKENLAQFPNETKLIEGAMTGRGAGTVLLNRDLVCPKVDTTGVEVGAVSLEGCMPEGDDILLKMDIEYAEFDVLFNAPGDLLRRFSTICMEIHDSEGRTSKAMKDYLNVLGFNLVWRSPMYHWDWGPNGEQLNIREVGAENAKFKRR